MGEAMGEEEEREGGEMLFSECLEGEESLVTQGNAGVRLDQTWV